MNNKEKVFMEKNKMIIVDGPQGTGKTTLTNFLRDNISGANLYRLSGQKDKTMQGLKYSTTMYNALLDYLTVMQDIPMHIIFDRTFITEEVYSRLGYKAYSFTNQYNNLLERINSLKYEIYYFSLYLEDINLYASRIVRESHHNYQAFSLENSANQQKIYMEISNELKKYNKIKVIDLQMDNFKMAYDKVKKILDISLTI